MSTTGKIIGYGITTIVGGSVIYLYSHFKKQIELIKSSCIKPGGIKFNNVSLTHADINLVIKFYNNSDLGFYIENQDYQVSLNGKFIASIKSSERITVLPRSGSPVPSLININAVFNPTQVFSTGLQEALAFISKTSDSDLNISGSVTISTNPLIFGKLAIKKKVPINISWKISEFFAPSTGTDNCAGIK